MADTCAGGVVGDGMRRCGCGVVALRKLPDRGGIGGMKDPFGCDESSLLSRAGTVDRAAARRAVGSRALGAADLNALLDMLGLRPEDDPSEADRH